MNITVQLINNEKDYAKTIKRIGEIFQAKPGTAEGLELEILVMLIEKYDAIHYPLPAGPSDPIELIKHRMDQMNITTKDLVPVLGASSRVSEILNKRRKLTLDMIRGLSEKLRVPVELLIADYKLAS
jgi:HTH-type transcriptional regulator/antitoxin HigA